MSTNSRVYSEDPICETGERFQFDSYEELVSDIDPAIANIEEFEQLLKNSPHSRFLELVAGYNQVRWTAPYLDPVARMEVRLQGHVIEAELRSRDIGMTADLH